jgi:uncharacterized protein YbjQ (UPF0145 family)
MGVSMIRTFFGIASLLGALCFISSCATPLTDLGANVRVTNQYQEVSQCKKLVQITSSSNWGGVAATGVGFESAMNQLKNKAAQMGGNAIKTLAISNTMGGTSMIGDVYKCPKN